MKALSPFPRPVSWLALYHLLSQVSFAVPSSSSRWSEWSPWSSCSRTCGGGVAFRSRTCEISGLMIDSQLSDESKTKRTYYSWGDHRLECIGENGQHKLCNVEECPPGSSGYTDQQCSAFNNRLVAGRRSVKWLAVEEHPQSRNPCELRCRSHDSTMTLSFGKMANGTRCGQSSVCINGRCVVVGCDGLVGSTVRADMCGVCGGRNFSCVQVQQMYSSKKGELFNLTAVTVIPSGATSIYIEEHTLNTLSLWDRWPYPAGTNKTAVPVQQKARTSPEDIISAGGALFVHKTQLNGSETLSSKGATRSPVTLAVYLVEKGSPNIRYEYWIPKEGGGHRDVTTDLTNTDVAVLRDGDVARTRPPSSEFFRRAQLSVSSPSDNRIPLSVYQPGRYAETLPSRPGNDAIEVPDRKDFGGGTFHGNEETKRRTKKMKPKKGRCPICHRARNQRRHFCKSDIVVHALVLSFERLDGSLRYDVIISESYRNLLDLQQREFFWVPDARCPCPKLRVGREYVITAQAHNDLLNKESKFVVDSTCFVRRFTERRRKQLERLRETQSRRCNVTT
uniref:NTR domain-containing protein n=1 Tax=Ixodes scapularis TaxID=6945 RepID=A0A4D5RQU5_IXOSC